MPKRIIEPLIPQISAKPSGTPGKIPPPIPLVDRLPKENVQNQSKKPDNKRKKEKAPDPLIGQLLEGKYRVIEEINSGGMGSIYLANNEVLDKLVVVKTFINPSLDPDASARELKASDFGHPNIIYVLDSGLTPSGNPFIVMQRLLGEDLSVFLKKIKRLNWRRVLQIADDICSALSFLHNKKIYHCDIKPSNLFLAEQDGAYVVKLLDFGLAKICNDGSIRNLNETGEKFVGTPAYASPEQAQNRVDIDHRVDIYSFGVTMYEMLCGSIPFISHVKHPDPVTENNLRVLDYIRMHAYEPPPTFNEKGIEDVPLEVERDIVMRALEKDPNKRFQSMAEMRVQIAAVLKKYSSAPAAEAKEKSTWNMTVSILAHDQNHSIKDAQFEDSAPYNFLYTRPKPSAKPKVVIAGLLLAASIGTLYYQNKDGCIDEPSQPIQAPLVKKGRSMKDGVKPKADDSDAVSKPRESKPDASIRKRKTSHLPSSQPTKPKNDAGEESESDSMGTADPSDNPEVPDNPDTDSSLPDTESQDKDTNTPKEEAEPESKAKKDNPDTESADPQPAPETESE